MCIIYQLFININTTAKRLIQYYKYTNSRIHVRYYSVEARFNRCIHEKTEYDNPKKKEETIGVFYGVKLTIEREYKINFKKEFFQSHKHSK